MSILTEFINKEGFDKILATLYKIPLHKLGSHRGSFSSPDAPKNTYINIPFNPQKENDGYIYTENTEHPLDDFTNTAANLAVAVKLAILPLEDGRPFYDDLEVRDTMLSFMNGSIDDYDAFRKEILSLEFATVPTESSSELPQIYFELEDYSERYLLSILHPSSLMFRVKEDILLINNSKENPSTRLYNITQTSFGGNQPQNISCLNSREMGTALLLPNLPPKINTNYIRKPKRDFFAEMMRLSDLNDEFIALSKALHNPRINIDTKQKRKNAILDIFDYALIKAFKLREFTPGWTDETNIPENQKKWIDSKYATEKKTSAFLKEIANDFAVWLVRAYEIRFPDDTLKLNDNDIYIFARDIRHSFDSAEV